MRPSRCLPAIKVPYELTPQSAELLAAAASETCQLFRGTGVAGWKNKGRKPDVCRCARNSWRANADEVNEKLSRLVMNQGAVVPETVITDAPAEPPQPVADPPTEST